jgi:hypothetical protein
MSDLWWTKWHCNRFFSQQYVGFSPIVIIPPVIFTHLHLNTRTALSEGQAGEVSSNSAKLQLEHYTKATLGSQPTQHGKITYFLDMYLSDMWLLIQHVCPCWRRMVSLEAQWCNVCRRIKSVIDRPINNRRYHPERQCTIQKLCFINVSN